jgi:hypothetical protein
MGGGDDKPPEARGNRRAERRNEREFYNSLFAAPSRKRSAIP